MQHAQWEECENSRFFFSSRMQTESTETNNGSASPSAQNRFTGFRPASARSSTCTTPSKPGESDKPSWNGTNTEQQQPATKSPSQTGTGNLYRRNFHLKTNFHFI